VPLRPRRAITTRRIQGASSQPAARARPPTLPCACARRCRLRRETTAIPRPAPWGPRHVCVLAGCPSLSPGLAPRGLNRLRGSWGGSCPAGPPSVPDARGGPDGEEPAIAIGMPATRWSGFPIAPKLHSQMQTMPPLPLDNRREKIACAAVARPVRDITIKPSLPWPAQPMSATASQNRPRQVHLHAQGAALPADSRPWLRTRLLSIGLARWSFAARAPSARFCTVFCGATHLPRLLPLITTPTIRRQFLSNWRRRGTVVTNHAVRALCDGKLARGAIQPRPASPHSILP